MTVPQKKTNLTRLTINLIPRATAALHLASEISGDSRTDTMNRAIQLYAYVTELSSRGYDILVRHPDGTVEQIKLM